MRSRVAGLMPNASSPMRASPLSLSRTRLNFSAAATSGCFFGLGAFILFCLAHLRRHLGSEIAGFLLDTLADHVQDELRDRGAFRFEHRLYGLFVVLNKTLSEE